MSSSQGDDRWSRGDAIDIQHPVYAGRPGRGGSVSLFRFQPTDIIPGSLTRVLGIELLSGFAANGVAGCLITLADGSKIEDRVSIGVWRKLGGMT